MPKMTEEVKSYRCNWCGKLYSGYLEAERCAFDHARLNFANALLSSNYNLGFINYRCGFGWELSDKLKEVTKDNCFVFSHWQCCNKPAYRIVRIDKDGCVYLHGWGSWSGGYGNSIFPDELPEPHPKEDLFIYSKEGDGK